MKPFCKVIIQIGIFFISIPYKVVWLIGLVFAGNKSPVVAGNIFKVEQGEHCAIDAKDLKNILHKLPSVDWNDAVLICGYLNMVCDTILKSSNFSKAKNTDAVLYQKVISYIAEHYRENISLKGIARHFGYNEKYLSSTVFSLTGIHFTKFVATYRIGYAMELLKNTSLKISDIAHESGFSAINSFNRAFKEFAGITPYEYRCKIRI